MDHIFSPEMDTKTQEVLESLNTAIEAASIMLASALDEDWILFNDIAETLGELLIAIYESSMQYKKIYNELTLDRRCQSLIGSLYAIRKYSVTNLDKCLSKIEFELIPILEESYMDFYYQAFVLTYPDREKQYFEKDMYELAGNKYINKAVETGVFKYDVSICVLAYNKLEYTKLCVNALLENIPEDLNYELILWDNGSTDGTVNFFESINPTKLIESRVNWGSDDVWHRINEGRYFIHVSNDVVVAPHSIENLVKAIKSDDTIGKIVPSTPNISNYQSMQCGYENLSGLNLFAEKNNVYDPYRHEERTRLCDPIGIWDSVKNFSSLGTCPDGYLTSTIAFPDDKASFLMRRRGYKQLLCKDAYCHHFGSVTINDDVEKSNKEAFYNEGKKVFKSFFEIDPWGTGFCYTSSFLSKVVNDSKGHADVLGINCGMGSNSLKIKEQLKEYCHNTDCTLYNITDCDIYFPDLKGISDQASIINSCDELEKFMGDIEFDYIVMEEPFLVKCSFSSVMNSVANHLKSKGTLFLKTSDISFMWVKKNKQKITILKDGWISYKK